MKLNSEQLNLLKAIKNGDYEDELLNIPYKDCIFLLYNKFIAHIGVGRYNITGLGLKAIYEGGSS